MTVYSQNDPIMAELRSLLVSPPVQKIRFRFGTFQLLPLDFHHLALKLADPSSRVSILVDPVALKKLGPDVKAAYNKTDNQFKFANDTVMRTSHGRAIVVHESVHAIFDLRNQVSMRLAEESIAYLAYVWYHLEVGTETDFLAVHNDPLLLKVTKAVRARGGAAIPEVTLSERIEIRRLLRKEYTYRPRLSGRGGGFK
jgi:hypothetical protein